MNTFYILSENTIKDEIIYYFFLFRTTYYEKKTLHKQKTLEQNVKNGVESTILV